ncbi:MAG: FAD-dependent oxidoreductase [Myxococcales bacterium]|nr:FAD-dependent oxidoreductase [Myxococcales bacterium]MCB9576900.1 FAD-dependent oxidoreductase [Polyangiaceae bacterium]
MAQHFDVIVLGGGPAGLTAGIYLGRARLRTLIVDSGSLGGQMNLTYAVANYPGHLTASGREIAMTMKAQAEEFGCELLSNSDVTRIDLSGPEKVVEIEDEGTFTAKAVIIASGGVPRTLGLDSESRLKGHGISYCATCDGDFFTGQHVVAIGGGNSAIEEAIALTRYAETVTVVHEFDHFQAHPFAVEEAKRNPKIRFVLNQEVREFVGSPNLEKVRVRDKSTGEEREIPATGCFVFIGYVPNTEMFRGQIALNERGEILTNEEMKTNVPGVFAAGDSRHKRYRQITTAVADGTIAALAATEYLRSDGRSPTEGADTVH